MSQKRDHWSSSFGLILAASGAAVGLGNLWRFPYITWENGGGAFVLVYLLCIVILGLPVMMCEFLIGRSTQKSTVPALEELGGRVVGDIGWSGVLCGAFVMGFYAVIAGWSISSFIDCMNWSVNGYASPDPHAFGAFVSNGPRQILLSLCFSVLTAAIVYKGISNGIEKASKVLMPVLIVILFLMFLSTMFMDGFSQSLSFLFTPDFSKLTGAGILEALGHAFFSLSLGMGTLITYGSYMDRKDSIPKATYAVSILDTVIALVACVVLFTVLFTFPEIQEEISGDQAGMLFILLPKLFYTKMTGGAILGPVFFILVGFAALSSTIALLEVVVAFSVDKLKLGRGKATLVCSVCIYGLTALCALSLGASTFLSSLEFMGQTGLLGIISYGVTNWFLPIGGFLISIFVGWFVDKERVVAELGMVDTAGQPNGLFSVFLIMTRWVAPLVILVVFYNLNFGAGGH